jgi:hypothetical protein
MEIIQILWNFWDFSGISPLSPALSPGHGSQRSALRLSVAPSHAQVQPVQSPVTAEARAAQEAAEKMVAEGVLCSTGGTDLGNR